MFLRLILLIFTVCLVGYAISIYVGLFSALFTILCVFIVWTIVVNKLESKHLSLIEEYIGDNGLKESQLDEYDLIGEVIFTKKYCDVQVSFVESGIHLLLNNGIFIPWSHLVRLEIYSGSKDTELVRLVCSTPNNSKSKLFLSLPKLPELKLRGKVEIQDHRK